MQLEEEYEWLPTRDISKSRGPGLRGRRQGVERRGGRNSWLLNKKRGSRRKSGLMKRNRDGNGTKRSFSWEMDRVRFETKRFG